MRLRRALLAPLLTVAVLLVGCAAPAQTQTAPAGTPAPAPATGVREPPPMSTPLPARKTPVKVDTHCTGDAQCVVKNVGSCCGQKPACVNVDSPTDPAAVQAQCQASGRMGICGFRQITACQCQAGTCMPADDGPGVSNGSIPAPEPIR